MKVSATDRLNRIYGCLLDRYGPQKWWPADGPFEVIVGAILTQNTAWANVEKAIANLKAADLLDPQALRRIPAEELAAAIRPSGYFNTKARKLKAFAEWFRTAYGDSLERMFAADTAELRAQLLAVYGIGEETADSIILYAARKPVFVIDAYTHRIMDRVSMKGDFGSYASLQSLFMSHLPADPALFNEYHALLVRHGKEVCKKTSPHCDGCCLRSLCRFPP